MHRPRSEVVFQQRPTAMCSVRCVICFVCCFYFSLFVLSNKTNRKKTRKDTNIIKQFSLDVPFNTKTGTLKKHAYEHIWRPALLLALNVCQSAKGSEASRRVSNSGKDWWFHCAPKRTPQRANFTNHPVRMRDTEFRSALCLCSRTVRYRKVRRCSSLHHNVPNLLFQSQTPVPRFHSESIMKDVSQPAIKNNSWLKSMQIAICPKHNNTFLS